MSRYAENLGRAARMLKRLDDIGGPSELEGVSLKEIIGDVLEAQNRAFMAEAMDRVGLSPSNVVDMHSWKVFACNPDESGGLA
jgi:hypothetical protein